VTFGNYAKIDRLPLIIIIIIIRITKTNFVSALYKQQNEEKVSIRKIVYERLHRIFACICVVNGDRLCDSCMEMIMCIICVLLCCKEAVPCFLVCTFFH
jgi:hypothetical protein